MTTEEFHTYQEQLFDSYCKRVIQNESIDAKREIARLAKHETVFSAMSAADAAQLITEDVYRGEPTVFHVRGYSVVVLDESLGQALTYLIRPLREVILLRFFCDKSIDQIAALVNLSPTTVRYRCQKAMERLKNILQDIEK